MMVQRSWFIVLLALMVLSSSCEDPGNFNGRYSTGIDYPRRDIRLIIPFGKGSSSDQFARHFAKLLSKELPVDVTPANFEGAGGLIGMIQASRRAPDGYTILEITPSHVISDVLNRSEIRLRENFDPLALIQKDYYLLLSKAGQSSLLTQLNDNNKTSYTIGGISPRGLDEMTMKALARALKKEFHFIPYPSGYELHAAVLSGEIDLILGKMISNLKHLKAGGLKAELLLNQKRLIQIPLVADVPASGELGIAVNIQSWRGFAIRKGTPEHIRDYLVERIRYVYHSEIYQIHVARHLGESYDEFIGPKAFRNFWDEQYRFFSELQRK